MTVLLDAPAGSTVTVSVILSGIFVKVCVMRDPDMDVTKGGRFGINALELDDSGLEMKDTVT